METDQVIAGARPRLHFPPPQTRTTRPAALDTLVVGGSVGASAVSLLSDGELHALALGQGDPRLLGANDEDVALTSRKLVVDRVLDVHNVEASVVTLAVGDNTDTTHVTTTGDHGDDASVKLDEVGDLAGRKVNLDGVVNLDGRVRVADTRSDMSVDASQTKNAFWSSVAVDEVCTTRGWRRSPTLRCANQGRREPFAQPHHSRSPWPSRTAAPAKVAMRTEALSLAPVVSYYLIILNPNIGPTADRRLDAEDQLTF